MFMECLERRSSAVICYHDVMPWIRVPLNWEIGGSPPPPPPPLKKNKNNNNGIENRNKNKKIKIGPVMRINGVSFVVNHSKRLNSHFSDRLVSTPRRSCDVIIICAFTCSMSWASVDRECIKIGTTIAVLLEEKNNKKLYLDGHELSS